MILCIFLVHVAWNILYNCNPEGCPKLISHPFGLEMAAKSRKITEEQQNYLGRAKLFGKSTGKGGCGLKKPPEILKLPLLRQSRQKTATSQSPVTKKKMRHPRSSAFSPPSLVAKQGERTKTSRPKVWVGTWHPQKRNNEGKEGVREWERDEWCPMCGVREIFFTNPRHTRHESEKGRRRKEIIMNLKTTISGGSYDKPRVTIPSPRTNPQVLAPHSGDKYSGKSRKSPNLSTV